MERNMAMFHIRQVLISVRGSALGEAIETIIAEMEKVAPSASDNKQSTPCPHGSKSDVPYAKCDFCGEWFIISK